MKEKTNKQTRIGAGLQEIKMKEVEIIHPEPFLSVRNRKYCLKQSKYSWSIDLSITGRFQYTDSKATVGVTEWALGE